jgi:hypothetical protein
MKEQYDPRIIRRMPASRRANSLGQIDNEFDFGPQPLQSKDVPIDIQERHIRHYGKPGQGEGAGAGAGGFPDISQLIKDVHSIAGILVLRRGLSGRSEIVTGTSRLIIDNQEIGGRGFLLLNPAGVVGLTSTGTLFPSTSLVGAITQASAALGVANYNTARFTLKVTAFAGAGPVTFDLQTLDPVDGTTWITVQTVFSVTATGNVYANVGGLGIDTDARIFVTVPGGTSLTFTLGYVLKDGLAGTTAGVTQTIFVGQSGVTPVSGYPLLAGQEKQFYFMENVQLYAVTTGPSLTMNIFEF